MSRIESLDPDGFVRLANVTASVYGAAMSRPPELVVQRREIMQSHATRNGFVAVVARAEDDAVIGFGYGYRGEAGEWWHDIVSRALGRTGAKHWLTDAFELAELHVSPAYQGNGVGGSILDRVLDDARGTTVVLSTHDRESRARRLYRSRGFSDVLGGFVFPGSHEVYVIMAKDR